jgi:hypothetical protein
MTPGSQAVYIVFTIEVVNSKKNTSQLGKGIYIHMYIQ